MADDYITMQNRIADELIRSDLTSQIQLAIQSAIDFYQPRRFFFNETRGDTFSTVSGQEFYTSADAAFIATMHEIDDILFAQSTTYRYPLFRQTWARLEEWSINPSVVSSLPYHFAFYGQQIRMYPIPNGAYTCTVSGTKRLTPYPLANNTDSNAWTTRSSGEEMIRQRAKADLRCNVIQDADAIAEAAQFAMGGQPYLSGLERNAYMRLAQDTTLQLSTGRIQPTHF